MKILKTFLHNVEIYSIDEAFIDLSFMDESKIEKYGKEIQEKSIGNGLEYLQVLEFHLQKL